MADKSFGVRRLNIIESIESQNTTQTGHLNINAATVAISTNLTVTGVSSVGSAITMYGTSGIISATNFYGSGENLTSYKYTSLTGIQTQISGDTTPQLGGDLDGNSKSISDVNNLFVTESVGIGTTNTSSVDSTNTKALAVGIVTSYDSFNTNIVTDKIKLGYHKDVELYDDNPAFQLVGINSATSTLAIYRYEGNDQSPTLDFVKSRNTSPGNNSIVQPGDELGKITFNGDDGSDINNAGAEIKAVVGTSAGSDTSDMPGSLVFLTSPDDENTPKEALRIDYNQDVGIGTAIPTNAVTNQGALLSVAGIVTAHKLYVGGLEVTGGGGGGGSLDNIVEDTTPQLGGDLDGDSNSIDNVTNLKATGITTVGFATATDVWVSGTVTATTFKGDGSELTGITGGHWAKTDVGINTSSNVGIGTTNPVANLDISGKLLVGDSISHTNLSNVLDVSATTGVTGFRSINLIDTSSVIKFARNHNDYGPALDMQHWNSDISTMYGRGLAGISSLGMYLNNIAEGGYIHFDTKASGESSTEKVRIASDGKVGIGTTNPQGDLQVGTGITMYGNTGIVSAAKFVVNGETGFLKADGTVDSGTFADGAIASIVDDDTPQLGGDLDGDGKNIYGVGIVTVTDTLKVGSAITANAGIITANTYYGDGQYLDNVVTTGSGGQGGASIDNGSIVGTALSISGISTFSGNLNVDSNLLVGYSTSIQLQSSYDPHIQQVGTDLESSTNAIYNFSNANTSPRLVFVKSRSSDPHLRSKVNNGDELGRITFIGDDGSDIANGGAQISAIVDGTASHTADMPARLSFYTAKDGSSWAKPRLTIKNTGDVAIGTITPYINASYTSLTVGGSLEGGKGLIELNDGSDVARAHLYTDGGDFKVSTVGTAGTIRFITGGTLKERLRIDSNGDIAAVNTDSGGQSVTLSVGASNASGTNDGIIKIFNGGTGNGVLQWDYENNANRAQIYVYRSEQELRFTTAGTEKLRITSGGNIGVGTITPTSTLHVLGGTRITGVLTTGQIADSTGSVGTAASVLSSTGTGLAWVSSGSETVESTGDFVGLIKEEFESTAGKLSANPNIYLEDGMVHWFTTAETATSTPNIRYNGSTDLTTKMSVGQVATVTIITESDAGSGSAYSANIQIDGDAVTEKWLCATAPSSPAATSGYNIYTHTIIKKGSSGTTADDFLVLSTVANYDS